jgi:hypothetical protein
MDRITISFQPETYKKLQDNAENKKITINQYVRDLVDIGLRVEEAASKNEGDKNSVSDKLDDIKDFIKKHMTASYENLYLTRYIVTKAAEKEQEENSTALQKSKDKSTSFVGGLFEEK